MTKTTKNDPTPVEILERDYMTLSEAAEHIRSTFPNNLTFRRKQLKRAAAAGIMETLVVGRLVYVKKEEVERYRQLLRPTKTQPNKLRLDTSRDPASRE